MRARNDAPNPAPWHGAPNPAPTRPHVRNNEETLPLLPPVINKSVQIQQTTTTTRLQSPVQHPIVKDEKEDKIQDENIGQKPKKIDSDIEPSKVILEEVHVLKIGSGNLTEQNIIINTGNS